MLVATVSVNIAANVVSPAYDLANLAPKFITFRTGALITGVVGVLIFPWELISTPEFYADAAAAGAGAGAGWGLRRGRAAGAEPVSPCRSPPARPPPPWRP